MENSDYSKKDILIALRNAGLVKGDDILVHSNLGFFGKLDGNKESVDYCQAFAEAIFDVIGNEGTLIVPTFTYSFCWNKIFDLEKTATSDCGIFSEYIRKKPNAIRTKDGIHSITAVGNNVEYYTHDPPEHSFGTNSFWERFLKKDGKICRFNLNPDFNTFIHYVEKQLDVPYRFDKDFVGKMIIDGENFVGKNIHFVRDLNDERTVPDLSKLESKMKKMDLIKISNLGKGQILCYSSSDIFRVIENEMKEDPNFLIKGEFA
jgi:aminoglycoside 3-N-acetyltransferase